MMLSVIHLSDLLNVLCFISDRIQTLVMNSCSSYISFVIIRLCFEVLIGISKVIQTLLLTCISHPCSAHGHFNVTEQPTKLPQKDDALCMCLSPSDKFRIRKCSKKEPGYAIFFCHYRN